MNIGGEIVSQVESRKVNHKYEALRGLDVHTQTQTNSPRYDAYVMHGQYSTYQTIYWQLGEGEFK